MTTISLVLGQTSKTPITKKIEFERIPLKLKAPGSLYLDICKNVEATNKILLIFPSVTGTNSTVYISELIQEASLRGYTSVFVHVTAALEESDNTVFDVCRQEKD